MDNFKLPAYPIHIENGHYSGHADFDGFTKLEKASLMIAQGALSDGTPIAEGHHQRFALECVRVAKALLEEANK
jgi:hypothetical protein